MKPVIKKGKVAIFMPQGFLDSVNTAKVITIQDMQPLIANKFNMVLVSFKKIVYFNVNGIKMLVEILKKISKEADATVGFCDYTELQYKAFLKAYDIQLPFCLFETLDTALIYAGNLEAKENENILIYNDDSTQKSMQAIEFFDKGYNPVVAQTKDDYLKKLEDKEKFRHATWLTYLGLASNKIAAKTKKGSVIYYLKGYLDGEITEQFDIIYHQHCLKVGFKVFMFDATRVSSINIHATNFISKLATSGAEFGALFGMVGLEKEKVSKKFLQELEDAGILFFDTESEFFASEDVKNSMTEISGAASKKEKGKLTKQMVAKLPTLIDAAIDTICMMTNGIVEKRSAAIKPFNIEANDDIVASSIAFYGDLDGMITIAMTKSLAKRVCRLLIGEESDDLEILSDSLGELSNIIAGKSKSLLQKEEIDIMITLPRNYTNLNEVKLTLNNVQGILVDFNFGESPFVFYLSS